MYKTENLFEAEAVVLNLREAGILATILNQRDTAYGTFGSIFVRVPLELQQEALSIINNNNP